MKDLKNKIITVIIAAYNAEWHINKALDSILSQELPSGWELQLLLGVDCCHKTKRAVEKTKDPRLSKYMMKRNRGTYITFNTMMKYAEGEIITRFDADDIMYEGMLLAGINKINQGVDLVKFKCEEFPGKKVQRVPHGILMFKRTVYDSVGGFQCWRCGADTDFIQKISSRSFVVRDLKDKIYFGVRKGENTLTSSRKTGFGSPYRKNIQKIVGKNEKLYKQMKINSIALTGECVKI